MDHLIWNTSDQSITASTPDGQVVVRGTWHVDHQGRYIVDHTFVDESLRGQGMAGQLMEKLSDHFRALGVKAGATCSYAQVWYQKHKDAQKDILDA